jgi:hypothetical protein
MQGSFTGGYRRKRFHRDYDFSSLYGGPFVDSFGRRTVKVVPPPSSLSTEMEPRWASTMLFTMESPRPVPTI